MSWGFNPPEPDLCVREDSLSESCCTSVFSDRVKAFFFETEPKSPEMLVWYGGWS